MTMGMRRATMGVLLRKAEVIITGMNNRTWAQKTLGWRPRTRLRALSMPAEMRFSKGF